MPQGSVLGPLLVKVFLNDITSDLTCKTLVYANDLKRLTIIKSRDCINLHSDLEKAYLWCIQNNVYLNFDKCHSIILSRKSYPTEFEYVLNNKKTSTLHSI